MKGICGISLKIVEPLLIFIEATHPRPLPSIFLTWYTLEATVDSWRNDKMRGQMKNNDLENFSFQKKI